MKSVLDPTFRYVPSVETDLKKTFARVRREQRELELRQRHAEDAERAAQEQERLALEAEQAAKVRPLTARTK